MAQDMTVAGGIDAQDSAGTAGFRVRSFFDPATSTFSHLLYERPGGACAVIDAVLDYDARSGRTGTASADRIADCIEAQDLQVQWLLETHAHADHFSAARYLQRRFGGAVAAGSGIRAAQRHFGALYNLADTGARRGEDFDRVFADGEFFSVGALSVQVWHVPGHTPADVAYVIGDAAAFVGDTLFMPDVGTARCDFPGGDARQLYRSIQRLLALPASARLYLCHDYPPAGRAPQGVCSVGEQRARNIHLRDTDSDAFVAVRTARDATLAPPALMLAAMQVNIRAGALPAPENNGVRYLKIPLDAP